MKNARTNQAMKLSGGGSEEAGWQDEKNFGVFWAAERKSWYGIKLKRKGTEMEFKVKTDKLPFMSMLLSHRQRIKLAWMDKVHIVALISK